MDFIEKIANDSPMFIAVLMILMIGFFAGTQLGVSAELAEIEEGFAVQHNVDPVDPVDEKVATVAKK